MSKLKVVRKALNEELLNFVKRGSGIIYGAPGVGKSHSISVLVDALEQLKIPCVVVSVEHFLRGTSEEIFNYLNQDLGNLSQINAIPLKLGKDKGIFLIDGYDAARNPVVEENLQKTIRDIQNDLNNWNLIVTIREYDLEKNLRLQKLLNIIRIGREKNAFKIEEFTEDEMIDGVQSAGFEAKNIVSKGTHNFKRLIKNPFNLWLFTKIYDPKAITDFSFLQTESQLLKVYFDRIIGSNLEINDLISKVTRSMVESGTLGVDQSLFEIKGNNTEIESLFSNEILVRSFAGVNRIHFKHNILFDYFVSLYCFNNDPQIFISYLLEDKRRSLFLQQSLKFFFFDVWENKRATFWKLVNLLFQNKEPVISLISKTIPFLPVIFSLKSESEIDFALNSEFLFRNYFCKYVLYGYQVYPDVNLNVRPNIYEKISLNLDKSFIWNLCVQVSSEINRFSEISKRSILSNVLINAYNYLEQNKVDFLKGFLISNWILPGFIKTLNIDQEYKTTVLRNILNSIGNNSYDINQVYRICSEIKMIVDFYPILAEEVYDAVFSFKETSNESVEIGTPIMPMQSNKRQNYDMCFYNLDEAFNYFLEKAPSNAIVVGFKVGEKEIFRSHVVGKGEKKIVNVYSVTLKHKVILDYSYIWGDGSRHGDYGLQIVERAANYLGHLVDEGQEALAIKLYFTVLELVQTAFTWNLLIKVSAKYPKAFANKISFLLKYPEILIAPDFDFVIGNNLDPIFKNLSKTDQKEIEQAIIDIDKDKEEEQKKSLSQLKDKYILALPENLISSKELRKRRESISKLAIDKKFKKHVSIQSVEWTKFEHDFLKEAGVNMESQETKSSLSLINSFENSSFSEEKLTQEESDMLFKFLTDLLSNIENIENQTLQSDVLTRTLNKLNNNIFKIEESEKRIFEVALKILTLAAYHSEPTFEPEYHSKFDSLTWSHAPRTVAAELVCKLGVKYYVPEIKTIIHGLFYDQVPAVRYLISTEIFRVYFFNKELFWEILEARSKSESIRTIKSALLSSLTKIFLKDVSKAETIYKNLFDSSEKDNFSDMLGDCTANLASLSIGNLGNDILLNVIDDPKKYKNILEHVALQLSSNKLSFKQWNNDSNIFMKAMEYSIKLIKSCSALLTSSIQDQEEIREVYKVISKFITCLYFNSDFIDTQNLQYELCKNYFENLSPIIDEIVSVANQTKYLDIVSPMVKTKRHQISLMHNMAACLYTSYPI